MTLQDLNDVQASAMVDNENAWDAYQDAMAALVQARATYLATCTNETMAQYIEATSARQVAHEAYLATSIAADEAMAAIVAHIEAEPED